MKKPYFLLINLLTVLTLLCNMTISRADNTISQLNLRNKKPQAPVITPAPPKLNSKAYILIDVNSGKIIAEKKQKQGCKEMT